MAASCMLSKTEQVVVTVVDLKSFAGSKVLDKMTSYNNFVVIVPLMRSFTFLSPAGGNLPLRREM